MSYNRQVGLSADNLDRIHHASMEILARSGIAFHCKEAVELFQKHGFKVSGNQVFFTEEEVFKALKTVPEEFTLTARNSANSRAVGRDNFVLAPTYGPPFVVEPDGRQRVGTLEDYLNFAKLNQSSDVADIMGFKYVSPDDIPAVDAYLQQLKISITMGDKPFMGSTDDPQAAIDTMDILKLVFGEKLQKHYAIGLINPLSPLAYAEDMAASIMTYARHNQPVIILNMILAGASGPIHLAGLLALLNAEILGGIVLSQLAGPGSPVVYGTTSCPIYMKTGTGTVGAPETMKVAAAVLQLARYYKIPCRTGGSLTDSLQPDGQAMAEGALSLLNAVRGGVNFVLHTLGMMGGYIGISAEKWIMDEELCRYVKELMRPIEVADTTLCVEEIINTGSGGSFLTSKETMKNCRKAFLPPVVFNKVDEAAWQKAGGQDLLARVSAEKMRRLNEYTAPPIEVDLVRELDKLIAARRR